MSESFVPHSYALRIIARYKLRISEKASSFKKLKNVKHTDALDAICKREGYKDYYTFNKIISTLLERATFFGKQIQRVNCATVESPDLKVKYYLFKGELALEYNISRPRESILTPLHFINYHTQWAGWFDESNQIELRVATPVDPHQQLEIFRNEIGKQIYVINKLEDLFLWLHCWGGDALICEDLIKNDGFLSSWLEPHPRESF